MFRWYLSLLVICSLSKQVMKELRVTGITKKDNSVVEDENYDFSREFREVKSCRAFS